MVRRLFGAKPLSEPMVADCQSCPKQHMFMNFEIQQISFKIVTILPPIHHTHFSLVWDLTNNYEICYKLLAWSQFFANVSSTIVKLDVFYHKQCGIWEGVFLWFSNGTLKILKWQRRGICYKPIIYLIFAFNNTRQMVMMLRPQTLYIYIFIHIYACTYTYYLIFPKCRIYASVNRVSIG